MNPVLFNAFSDFPIFQSNFPHGLLAAAPVLRSFQSSRVASLSFLSFLFSSRLYRDLFSYFHFRGQPDPDDEFVRFIRVGCLYADALWFLRFCFRAGSFERF